MGARCIQQGSWSVYFFLKKKIKGRTKIRIRLNRVSQLKNFHKINIDAYSLLVHFLVLFELFSKADYAEKKSIIITLKWL